MGYDSNSNTQLCSELHFISLLGFSNQVVLVEELLLLQHSMLQMQPSLRRADGRERRFANDEIHLREAQEVARQGLYGLCLAWLSS